MCLSCRVCHNPVLGDNSADSTLVYIVRFFRGRYRLGAISAQLQRNAVHFSHTVPDLETLKMKNAFEEFFGLVI